MFSILCGYCYVSYDEHRILGIFIIMPYGGLLKQHFGIQVEQAQAGLEAISSSQKTINQLRENFLSIERCVLLVIFLKHSCYFLYIQLLGFYSTFRTFNFKD